MLARHVSDLTGPFQECFVQAVFADLVVSSTTRITTYQICKYSLYNAPDDGPVRSETCRANIRDE